MDLVFNDLSSAHPADKIDEARKRMDKLIQLVRLAVKQGASNYLYTQDNFLLEEIGPGYRISNWMNDNSVDIELRRYWLSKIDRRPYIQFPEEQFFQDDLYLHEFRFNDIPAKGLGIAYFREGLSISLDSDQCWNTSNLVLQASRLHGDSGEIHQVEISVPHASDPLHLNKHTELFSYRHQQTQAIKKASIKDGPDIVQKREQLFSSLEFCERVLGQLQDVQRGDKTLQPIIKKLFELESYFSTWSGIFDPNKLNHCTPESETNLRKYSELYTFKCPDEKYRLFSWHIRFTPGAGRIFFIPDSNSRKAIIGHIGGKIGD